MDEATSPVIEALLYTNDKNSLLVEASTPKTEWLILNESANETIRQWLRLV
jgi:hypothetical protein